MTTLLVVVVVVAVAAAIALAITRARRSRDGVDSFRRQIDALSPEARRNVVDQVQSAAERREQHADGEPESGDGDEDGTRGA